MSVRHFSKKVYKETMKSEFARKLQNEADELAKSSVVYSFIRKLKELKKDKNKLSPKTKKSTEFE